MIEAHRQVQEGDGGEVERFAGVADPPRAVAVIGGAGYVGGVTGVGLAHMGHRVTAVDINEERVRRMSRGEVPFHEPGLEALLRQALAGGRLRVTADLPAALADAEAVFVAVNTPRRDNGEADLSHIIQVARGLGRHLHHRTVIAVKSTAPVGSHLTIRRVLEQFGLHEGADYDLVANPEFLREGHAVHDFFYPDRVVVGGTSPQAVALIRELFAPLGAPILETSIEDAQMIKYAANAFLAMRVSFINEIANICERVGANVETVARGLGYDRRIGHAYLQPGLGFSGPCLPKDLEGLIRLAEDAGYEPFFLRAILEKNQHQRRQVLRKVADVLGASLVGRRIGALGLAFKPGTDDVRNSAAPEIIDYLERRGARVRVYDPMVDGAPGVPGEVVGDPYAAAAQADLLLILTAWPQFAALDLERLRQTMRAPNIVDATNLLDPAAVRAAGFTYVSVGRP
jgi:UDPglucose 6-dehydrogenase